MFLIGGPAFSGTTLLTLLLNQRELVCLDEPDFHNPAQAHRGVPLLRELAPDRVFPDAPTRALDWEETIRFTTTCAQALLPRRLGIKTCDRPFLELARRYRDAGHPVIAIVRDIRDALIRPLPPWVTEESLNDHYRAIWRQVGGYDLWIRYEDLVTAPEATLARIGSVLGTPLANPDAAPESWPTVHAAMLKLDRHELLKTQRISPERVGIWRGAGRPYSDETRETARLMGYPEA